MDTQRTEKFTREILAKSKLELTNPDFSNSLMNKIRKEKKKQIIIHDLVLYSLIFISIDTIIFALLKIMNIKISEITQKTSSFVHIYQYTKPLLFIYLLAIVFILVSILSRTQYKYSKMHN